MNYKLSPCLWLHLPIALVDSVIDLAIAARSSEPKLLELSAAAMSAADSSMGLIGTAAPQEIQTAQTSLGRSLLRAASAFTQIARHAHSMFESNQALEGSLKLFTFED